MHTQANLKGITSNKDKSHLRIVQSDEMPPSKGHSKRIGASNAIKNKGDVQRLKDYFLYKDNGKGRNAYNERNYALVVMALNCGKRIGDMLSLTVGDVLDESGCIRDAFYIREQKSERTARIYITKVMAEALALYLSAERQGAAPHSPLFLSRKTRDGEAKAISVQRVNQLLKEAKENLNIKGRISSHSLRKTFARTLITDNKRDATALHKVQMLLNHRSPETTLIYTDLAQDELDEFLNNNPV